MYVNCSTTIKHSSPDPTQYTPFSDIRELNVQFANPVPFLTVSRVFSLFFGSLTNIFCSIAHISIAGDVLLSPAEPELHLRQGSIGLARSAAQEESI